jgi:hypothetical protein
MSLHRWSRLLLLVTLLPACADGEDSKVDGAVLPDAGPDATLPDAVALDAAPDAAPGPDAAPPLPTGKVEISLWCGLPPAELTAARVAEVAAAGFTVITNACDGAAFNPTYNAEMLALAGDAGLTALVTDTRALEAVAGTNVEANLDGLVADYAAAPALLGYLVDDEPGVAEFPALATVVSGLRTRDPAHVTLINLFPDYASAEQLGAATYDDYVAQYLSVVQPSFFTYDHYSFLSDGSDGPTFLANLAVVRAHSLATGIPFGQYVQSISYTGHRTPTGPEKRWAALHTLAYGGRAVAWFTYWTPVGSPENFGDALITAAGVQTAQYAEVAEINRAVTALGRYLAPATSLKVFLQGPLEQGTAPRAPGDPVYVPSAAPLTVGLFAIGDDRYALLVNRDHASPVTTDVIVASGTGAVSALDVDTGELVPAPGAATDPLGVRVPVALAAGDALLLHLPGPATAGPPGAEAYFGTVRADAGWLDVVDASFGTDRLTTAGWGQCPEGTVEVGRDFQSNGFWLCARNDLADRTFLVGNVVADQGALFSVTAGAVTSLGPAGWDTCPSGMLLGHRMVGDGFWVCLE